MYRIPYLTVKSDQEIEAALLKLPDEPIACCNWPESYAYRPQVNFRACHNGRFLHLLFTVEEQTTRAIEQEDGKKVCLDSCVELFIQPQKEEPHYYNFEFNAIGTCYAACRTSRKDPQPLPAEALQQIVRRASLGRSPLPEFEGENRWSLLLSIPRDLLLHHPAASWCGAEVRMNLYKCGDELKQPHYLSWAPIATPGPDFHRPEFFVEAYFEPEQGAKENGL